MIDRRQLFRDLRTLGVRTGDLLNVKASLRAIGPIEGGAATLIEALLEAVGSEGTIVADSFVNVYRLPLSSEDAEKIVDQSTPSYAGALANAIIAHPRSHPHIAYPFASLRSAQGRLLRAGVHRT